MNLKSLTIAGMFVAASSLVAWQGPRMHGNMCMYNPSTETTVKGAVEDVTNASRGRMTGTHLFVKTAEGLVTIVLGQSSFISSSGFNFAKDDAVEVTGSKVSMGGKDSIVAREVVKQGKTLSLRDKDGHPKWAGKMMGEGGAPMQ